MNKTTIDFQNSHVRDVITNIKIFAENYAKGTNTYFCSNLEITESVIIGLAKNKLESGSALCPCRCYSKKKEEAAFSFWNCPCVPMRERKECHCMLFLNSEDIFSSNLQDITLTYLNK